MNGLTAVSLFAGIGGFDLALKRAGVRVAAAVEIDAACRGELARHFPETELFNDVTEVTGDQLRAAGFVPGRGVITGGFPCQDLSVAGRRAGLAGSRSGLFWHIMRLADDLRPRWLLLENVPGLLSAVCPCAGDGACVANGRAVRCGEWRAERIPGPADELRGDDCFVCGHPWDFHDAGGFCSPCQDTCDGLPEVRFRKVFIPDVSHGIKGGACPGGCMADHGGAMGTVLGALAGLGYGYAYRVLDAQHFGIPQRRDRVFIAGCLGDRAAPVEVLLEPEGRGGGHAASPQTRARVAGTLAASAGSGGLGGVGQSASAITSRLVEITASTLQGGGRRGHRIDAEGAAGGQLIPFDTAQITSAENRANPRPGDPAPALYATGLLHVAGAVIPLQDGRDFAKAQNGLGLGIPGDPSYTLDTTGAQSVAIPLDMRNAARDSEAGETAGTGIGDPGDPSFALSATLRAVPGVAAGMQVRRLTPLEYERLQGFPDEWTRWDASGAEQADSVRYRQAGNAVPVPVVEWITRRIVAVDASLVAAKGDAA